VSGTERAEPVREPGGDQDLRPVLGAQLDGDMRPVGRRALPDINRDIEHRPRRDADELRLGRGRCLVVQPAQRAGRRAEGMVVLAEIMPHAALGECLRVEGFAEEPPLVPELVGRDQQNAFENGLFDS
jgi:hypothetical protein